MLLKLCLFCALIGGTVDSFRMIPRSLVQTKYSTQPLPLISSSGFSARSQYDMQTMSTAVNTGNYASPATSIRGADPVESIMPPEFAKVITTDSVAKAVDEMRRFNKGAVCVFDVTGTQLTGIFTERDVLRVFDDGKSALTTAIETVMTPASKLIIGRPDDSTTSCRIKMVENRIRHLPIVGKDGQVVSMVSMTDIINALNNADLSSNLFGLNLAEVEEQAKDLANRMALESGEESSKQDTLRSAFVVAGAVVGAALLQHDWVHDNEWLAMSGIFLLGYVGIIFEGFFEFNKAAIGLLMATALWVVYAGQAGTTGIPIESALAVLSEKVGEVSEVVFFLMGAMTIVEIVDSHRGFKVVTDAINSKDKRSLMWVVGVITFFMSAILDNLTTTIVMVSLAKKLLPDLDDRKLFGAMIVIAANAGGAWTVIGDVTTTMLWINGQISAMPTITSLFLPSFASTMVSIAVLQNQLPAEAMVAEQKESDIQALAPRGKLVFATGILGLLSVPVFKALTGLPPYLGMLAALGVMWTLTDAIHAGEGGEREELMAPAALRKIDTSGVLFFLGILLSVGALDSAGILRSFAEVLDKNIPSQEIIATVIGIASAIIDNVPLVAATMGMYSTDTVPMDAELWQLIAFCAGTGGSIFVIGSAAGVALMGLEKVDFVWYAKHISVAAAAGYFTGIGTYLLQHNFQTVFEQTAPAMAALPAMLDQGQLVAAALPAVTAMQDIATTLLSSFVL